MPIGEPKSLTECRRFFREPQNAKQRQYEALRAYYVEGLPSAEGRRPRTIPGRPSQMQRPPSTSMHRPVRNSASSLARNRQARATSRGVLMRPSGMVSMNL